ncbi:hypothetical protein [Psychromonas sp. SP041]|uniref:hypothetical protein n=1 Tax=Psychromonas sp. SP041 TaxID=1365007 RepID=UPI0003F9E9CC|nr:hypothetical protein [Psychromonas sp. SP041]
MTTLIPEEIFPRSNRTIVRHETYGGTGSNQVEIIRSIKANFDNGALISAFTFAVHADPKDSSEKEQLAFLIEYSDGHIELFDKHSMSINRKPRESEILSMVRNLIQMGFGERLFYCTKRLPTKVFEQSPLLTSTVIKSKEVKALLHDWHEFTSINNEGHKTLPKEAYKFKEWDKLTRLAQTSVNEVSVMGLDDFVGGLTSSSEVVAGYLGRSFKKWIFTSITGRHASMMFCDERTVKKAYSAIVGQYKMKAYGDFIKEQVFDSKSQQLISANQTMLITEFDEHHQKWLFDRIHSS